MRDCDDILELMSARLDGELSGAEEAELQEHLRTCAACRALYADLNEIHAAIPGLNETPPPALMERVMEAIRAETPEPIPFPSAEPERKRRVPVWRAWGGVAAVLCVALLGTVVLRGGGSGGGDMAGGEAAPMLAAHSVEGQIAGGADTGAVPGEAVPKSGGMEPASGDGAAVLPEGQQEEKETATAEDGGAVIPYSEEQEGIASGGGSPAEPKTRAAAVPPDPTPAPETVPTDAPEATPAPDNGGGAAIAPSGGKAPMLFMAKPETGEAMTDDAQNAANGGGQAEGAEAFTEMDAADRLYRELFAEHFPDAERVDEEAFRGYRISPSVEAFHGPEGRMVALLLMADGLNERETYYVFQLIERAGDGTDEVLNLLAVPADGTEGMLSRSENYEHYTEEVEE